MKNIVLKLIMICLFSGCYAVFVAWENGGFSQLHDFQSIESNGMSAYLHQTSPIAMQAEKNELSILQNNQNSLASCVGIESLCEQAKLGIWVEHAKFLQHKDTGKLLVLSLDYLENNNTAKTLHNRYTASLLPQADRTEAWHYAWRTFLRSVTFLLLFNLLSMIFALFEKKDNRSIKTCRLKTFSDGMFHYQSLTRMNHIGRNDQFVKLFACQQAQLDGGFAQRFVVFVGGFGNFGGVFVADFTV